jgi:hypothetical protein
MYRCSEGLHFSQFNKPGGVRNSNLAKVEVYNAKNVTVVHTSV